MKNLATGGAPGNPGVRDANPLDARALVQVSILLVIQRSFETQFIS